MLSICALPTLQCRGQECRGVSGQAPGRLRVEAGSAATGIADSRMIRIAQRWLRVGGFALLALCGSPALAQQPPQGPPAKAPSGPGPAPKVPAAAAPAPAAGNEAALRQRIEQLEEQLVDLQVVVGTLEVAGARRDRTGARGRASLAGPFGCHWRRGRRPPRRHRDPDPSARRPARAGAGADARPVLGRPTAARGRHRAAAFPRGRRVPVGRARMPILPPSPSARASAP